MARGRTASSLGLSARRERAKELFVRGWGPTDVARELRVSPDTARRYQKNYLDEIQDSAARNPSLLRDVIRNTVRALDEVDQVRQEAWKRYEGSSVDATRATFLNTVLKAEEQRNKLLQLFGVKAEFISHVATVSRMQERLVQFLSEGEFCDEDRNRIVAFLETQELADQLDALPTTPEPSL